MKGASILIAVLACAIACASALCPNAINATCPLSPFESSIQLPNQIFCPKGGADSARGEIAGKGCESLAYCCSTVDRFDGPSASNILHVVGASQKISQTDGNLIVPASRTVRIEFSRPSCIGKMRFAKPYPTAGNVRVTIYYSSSSAQPSKTIEISSEEISSSKGVMSLPNCHVVAVALQPSASSPQALIVDSIDVCLLGAKVDTCGVCNGLDKCVGGAKTASSTTGASLLNAHAAEVADNSTTQINSTTEAPAQNTTAEEDQPALEANSLDVEDSIVWNADAPEGALRPIIPTVSCHKRLNSTTCFTVFGYQNPNNATIHIVPESNHFTPAPHNRGQPYYFSAGTNDAAFGVTWPCKIHSQIMITWTLVSNTTGLHVSSWTNRVSVHRDHAEKCSYAMVAAVSDEEEQ